MPEIAKHMETDDVERVERLMFALAAKHNVRLESFFVSTAIPVRVMEGIGARLSPDVEVGPSRISLRTPCCCLILTCLHSYFLRFVDASLRNHEKNNRNECPVIRLHRWQRK